MGRSSKFAELAAAYDTGGALSFRNKLINAAFTVNQRGYVSGTNTSTANQYTLDRWRVVTSGQNLTLASTGNVYTITAPAGGVEQIIEGINLTTGSYVLNWTGTATATVGGAAVVKGGTVSVTGGSNLTIRFTGGTVSQPQFEQGIEPTLFENRPVGLELSLCQRYYEAGQVPFTYAPPSGGAYYTAMMTPIIFKATKTSTSYNMSYSGIQVYAGGTPTNYTGTVSTVTPSAGSATIYLSTTVTNNHGFAGGAWACDGELV